jgi:hypothetical protein
MDIKYPVSPGGTKSSPTFQHTAGPDTKQPQGVQGASRWAVAGFTVLHATKALVAQGVAYGVMIGSRMVARELLEAARNSSEEDLGTAAILSAAALSTFVFDQLCTGRAVSMMYGWLRKGDDGVPAQPVGSKTGIALALIPTALSGALLAREVYGAPENGSVLAVDLAAMMIGWRAGRLARDVIQQGVARCLPKLTIVDADTGRSLTHQQKKTFDDTRMGYQLAAYTATVFLGAFVTTPALRGYLGSNERADSADARLYAMLAPMINSVLVEAFDDVISPLVQSMVAPRQNLVVKVDPGERPKDLGKAMLDHGSMRAFMGVFVTDLAQLILSIDRSGDFFKALGTAVGSVATSIMEIRAKSVGVQSGVRDTSREFKELSNELIRAMQRVTKIKFTDDQREAMRGAIKAAHDGFVAEGWGKDAMLRTERMTGFELNALVTSTLRDNPLRHIKYQASQTAQAKLQRDRDFKPESADQARRLLSPDRHVAALPLLRALDLGKFPGIETKSPDVHIDIKAPSGTARPASTDISQPTSPDGLAFNTRHTDTDGPVQPDDIDNDSMHFHPSPVKRPPLTPRLERQGAAPSHALPACEVVDSSGRRWTEPPPLGSEVTIQRGDFPLLRGTVADRGPHEVGFVYIATADPGDLTPYGEVVGPLSITPLLKVRIADAE